MSALSKIKGVLPALVTPFDENERLDEGRLRAIIDFLIGRGVDEKIRPQLACLQAALPTLRKSGSVTFISAVSAQVAMPGVAGIGAINGMLLTVAPILAVELKPLRVNVVAPGVIDTPWWDFLPDEQRQAVFAEYAGKTPVGRIGRADDVASAIGFLVSNGFMTGQVLTCDGGLRFAA
ncbi:MAG: SDR family oxidoreductase [Mesorhizobium sp.]|nr:SDR family oxidoreductase [Mesorhizobium sp.]